MKVTDPLGAAPPSKVAVSLSDGMFTPTVPALGDATVVTVGDAAPTTIGSLEQSLIPGELRPSPEYAARQ